MAGRRVLTARQQYALLLPWRNAAPQRHPDLGESLRRHGVVHTTGGRRLAGSRLAVADQRTQETRLLDSRGWTPHPGFAPSGLAVQGARAYAGQLGLPDPHQYDFSGVTVSKNDLLLVAVPSETVTVMVAVPNWLAAGVSSRVRLAPLPPTTRLALGMRDGLSELAVTTKEAAAMLEMQDDSLDAQFKELDYDSDIEDRLAELKASVSPAAEIPASVDKES